MTIITPHRLHSTGTVVMLSAAHVTAKSNIAPLLLTWKHLFMEKNAFNELSTQQANQLRIALITISVGLTAFLSGNVDQSVSFRTNKYLVVSVVASSMAALCGLLAWKFSAKMFYDMGAGIQQGINHKLKDIFDLLLGMLLIVAVMMSATYLVVERKPARNIQTSPIAETMRPICIASFREDT